MHDDQPVARIIGGIGEPARHARRDRLISFAVGRRFQQAVAVDVGGDEIREDLLVVFRPAGEAVAVADEAALLRHYLLADDDLIHIDRRRRPENRIGFALQLCALRYPGRTLAPGELIPHTVSAFLGAQLGIAGETLAAYAVRRQTRHQHMEALRRHGLRNAALPVLTVSGLQLTSMVVGAVVIESVFVIPGVGSMLLDAVSVRDLTTVQTLVMLLVAFALVVNALTDVAYRFIDPRITAGDK